MSCIYIYSDESGTFDYKHCKYFVYGGVVFLSKKEKNLATREYLSIEREIRKRKERFNNPEEEIKASKLNNASKRRLLGVYKRCICYPFAIVIHSPSLKQKENIAKSTKTKQRYLDWAYKIGIKKVLEELINKGEINPNSDNQIRFFMDEHQSATDGRYELQEALDAELNIGTFNYDWMKFYGPIFPNKRAQIICEFCDSKTNVMIRLADIIANYAWHKSLSDKKQDLIENGFITKFLP